MDKPHILVVDDNHINRLFLTSALNKLDCEVTAVDNGHDAINTCENNPINLILMDVRMHGMDGIEATQHIRNIPAHQHTPVIAVSAEPLNHQSQQHFSQQLIKPVKQQQLKTILETYCGEFDHTQAMLVAHHDINIVNHLRSAYLKDLPQQLQKLQAAHNDQDMGTLGRLCHDLLGASKVVAAQRIIDALEDFQALTEDKKLKAEAMANLSAAITNILEHS